MYDPRRRDTTTGWIIFLSMLIPAAFGGGWFCGREHLKYELKQAMQEAAEALQQGFGNGLKDNTTSRG